MSSGVALVLFEWIVSIYLVKYVSFMSLGIVLVLFEWIVRLIHLTTHNQCLLKSYWFFLNG